jgi:hypothetical protein
MVGIGALRKPVAGTASAISGGLLKRHAKSPFPVRLMLLKKRLKSASEQHDS